MLSANDQAGGRVLIVEDDADIADVLRRSLRNEGYDVRATGDGVEALDLAAGFLPDLVVLDLGLPGLDGVEVCRRLRSDGDVLRLQWLNGVEADPSDVAVASDFGRELLDYVFERKGTGR